MQNPFDRMCRFLAKLLPEAFLLWLLRPGTPQLRFVEWLDTRGVPFPNSPDRTSDTVAWVLNHDAGGVPWLIVLEFQVGPETNMVLRLVLYQTLLQQMEKPNALPGDRFVTGSLLVHLTGRASATLANVWPEARLNTQAQPCVVNFCDYSAVETIAGVAAQTIPPVALAFVPLMQGGAEPATVAEWQRVGLLIPEYLRPSVAAGAVLFAELTKCQPLWENALEEWNMQRSTIVDKWQAEAEKRGEDRGIQKGLVLGAYRMLCKKGASAEQARIEVIAEFGPDAAAILDRALAAPAE
jgi:hypothetical protein